jgi:hypothetical protein
VAPGVAGEREFEGVKKMMNVGTLRAALKDLPDDMDIVVEFDAEEDGEEFENMDSFFQLAIDKADVEERCDEKPALYVLCSKP